MSGLAGIPVAVEHSSGNVELLLHEIGHALDRLLTHGQGTLIDLRSVPLAPGEEDRILEFLGTGEVRAELDAGGLSTVNESRFAGVWVVTHHDPGGDIIGRLIEISLIPDILRSQPPQMREGREALARDLALRGAPASQSLPRATAKSTDGEAAATVLEER
jgi:hydrogenase-1 operon protein HyaF